MGDAVVARIVWWDAGIQHDPISEEDITEGCFTMTTGFLVRNEKHVVVIAQSRNEWDEWSEIVSIPRSLVRSFHVARGWIDRG